MSAALQFDDGCLRKSVFKHDFAQIDSARMERRNEMVGMEGGRVYGGLKIESVLDMMQEELDEPLILVVGARRAESEDCFAIFERQGG